MNNFIMNSKKYKTVTLKPFSYIRPSVNSAVVVSLVLLLPQIVMLFLTKSYSALYVIFLTSAASCLADFLFGFVKKNNYFSWGTALFQGIIIGMLLPDTFPLPAVFLISFVVLILCKYLFGGFATAWANPVCVTVAVCYFINASSFAINSISSLDLQSRNVALALIQNGTFEVFKNDSLITTFLNKTIFSLFKVSIPEGYVSLFWDTGSSIPAFRFNFLTLISSLVLFSLEITEIYIPAIFITVYALAVKFIGPVFTQSPFAQGDIILCILTSGTLFSTLFVLQWYGTTPLSVLGKIVYAIAAGFLAFFIMGYGLSPVGYVFMTLLMNVISTVIQNVESFVDNNYLTKRLVPLAEKNAEVVGEL